jgi:aspartyl-tRNA(Asn)/glutamyl-tRNA(Gln) amidotransferase subunit B
VQAAMPELPEAMKARFVRDYALPAADAATLTANRELSAYFEEAAQAEGAEAKIAANWILGEVSAALHKSDADIAHSPVSAPQLAGLLRRIADGTISGKIAKDVFDAMWVGEGDADAIIEKRGLRQISDEGAIAKIVDDAIAANPAIVAEYKAGREKAFNSLVGKVMAASKGKANPAQVNAILKNRLG